MANVTKSDALLNSVKAWVFPSLITVLATLIWRDLTELRSDVKALLAQSNIDKTKIENLERSIYGPIRKPTAYLQPYDKLLFKHEDFYNIEDKIIKE